MHRAFISTVVATALAFTGITSSMAQAGEYRYVPAPQPRSQNHVDPVAATIAGIAALVIVGKAIENNKKHSTKNHRNEKDYARPQVTHNQQKAQKRGHGNGHKSNRGHGSKRQNAHRSQRNNWYDNDRRGHGARNGHNGHRQQRARNNHRGYEWHRHGNGHGHKHPHGPRHHRGRH